MKIRHLILGMAALALGVVAPGYDARASGGSITTSFGVSASVANACTVSATDITFGAILSTAGGSVANNGSTGVVVTCTADGLYDVGLQGAGHTGDGVSALSNASAACGGTCATIPYTLYQDSGATALWGLTASLSSQGCTGTVGSGACTGSGSAQNYEVYAKLGTLPVPLHLGTYSDTVTVTVTYY